MRVIYFLLPCILISFAFGDLGSNSTTIGNGGKLSEFGVPMNGHKNFKFAIVNESGTPLWNNSEGIGPTQQEPATPVRISVVDGNWQTNLGDLSLMKALDISIFKQGNVYLRTWVQNSSGSYAQLADKAFTGIPFSINSSMIDGAQRKDLVEQTEVSDTNPAAGQIPRLNSAGKLPSMDASNLNNLDGTKITKGPISSAVIEDVYMRNDRDTSTTGSVTAASFSTAGDIQGRNITVTLTVQGTLGSFHNLEVSGNANIGVLTAVTGTITTFNSTTGSITTLSSDNITANGINTSIIDITDRLKNGLIEMDGQNIVITSDGGMKAILTGNGLTFYENDNAIAELTGDGSLKIKNIQIEDTDPFTDAGGNIISDILSKNANVDSGIFDYLEGKTVNIKNTTLTGTFSGNNNSMTNMNIDSGTLDNTPIGSQVPSTGTFISLNNLGTITTNKLVANGGIDTFGDLDGKGSVLKNFTIKNSIFSLSDVSEPAIFNIVKTTDMGIGNLTVTGNTILGDDLTDIITLKGLIDFSHSPSSNVNIDSGVIDNTPVGASIPSTGRFTDINANNLTVNTVTGSQTSTFTTIHAGDLIVTGNTTLSGPIDNLGQSSSNVQIVSGNIDGVEIGVNTAGNIIAYNLTTLNDTVIGDGSSDALRINATGDVRAPFNFNSNTLSNAAIIDSSINNTPIGQSTAAAGTFTNINADTATIGTINGGDLNISGNTTLLGPINNNHQNSSNVIIVSGNLDNVQIGETTAGNITANNLTVNQNTILGDASTDTLTINATVDAQASIGLNNNNLSNATIIDSSLNNSPIGATTPHTGAFTTLNADTINGGDLSISGNTILLGPIDNGGQSSSNVNIISGNVDGTEIGMTTAGNVRAHNLTVLNDSVLGNSSGDSLTVGATTGFQASVNFNSNTVSNATIIDSSLNNSPIGASTPHTGAFTTLNADTATFETINGTDLNISGNTTMLGPIDNGGQSSSNVHIVSGNLNNVEIGTTSAGNITAYNLTVEQDTTLGDASGDTLRINATVDAQAPINFNSQDLSNAVIISGTINGTPIGGTSPSTATFTTLNVAEMVTSAANITSGNIDGVALGSETPITDATVENITINNQINLPDGAFPVSKIQVPHGQAIIGNTSNQGVSVTLSQDISVNDSGAVTIATGVVNSAKLADGGINLVDMANNSVNSDIIVDSSVTSADVLNNTLTADDLGANSVGASELADNSVDSGAIQTNAIDTTDKIADGVVTLNDLAGNSVDSSKVVLDSLTQFDLAANSVTLSEMADNAVGSNEVIDNSLTSDDLGSNSVGSSELADNSVDPGAIQTNAINHSDKIASDVVNSDDILDNSIGSIDIGVNAVTSSELADNSVDTGALQTNSVTTVKIEDLAITLDKLALNSVNSGKIVDESITSADLGPNSVGLSELADDSIGSDEVIDNSLTGDDIATNAISSSELADNSVDTNALQNSSVTSVKIDDGTITVDDLANNSVGTNQVIADSLTKFDLANNSVTVDELADDSVGSGEVIDNSLGAIDLATDSVGSSELANNSVDTAAIIDSNVTSAKILNNSILAEDIATDAVTSSEIIADGVGSSEIAANAVGSSELADNAVDTNALQNSSVTDGKLAGSISASKISGTAITASQYTTNGDILYRNSGNPTRLGIGSDGQVLTVNSGVPTWQTNNGVPTGSMVDYWGTSAPTGWLFAKGQWVSKTTYADLYTLIGDTFTNGNPSSINYTAQTYYDNPSYPGMIGWIHAAAPNWEPGECVILPDGTIGYIKSRSSTTIGGHWTFYVSRNEDLSDTITTVPRGTWNDTTSYTGYFQVPDMRGRSGVGVGQSPTMANYSFGTYGGQENVWLTTSHLPTHNHGMDHGHTVTDDGHAHSYQTVGQTVNYSQHDTSAFHATAGATTSRDNSNITIPHGSSTGKVTDSAGSGNGFSVINPIYVVNKIIKY